MMTEEKIKQYRTCLYLLPKPGDQVVNECLDEIERLRKALYDIANPLQRIKKGVPEGAKLNGQMAVTLMESPNFYKDIARQGLGYE